MDAILQNLDQETSYKPSYPRELVKMAKKLGVSVDTIHSVSRNICALYPNASEERLNALITNNIMMNRDAD